MSHTWAQQHRPARQHANIHRLRLYHGRGGVLLAILKVRKGKVEAAGRIDPGTGAPAACGLPLSLVSAHPREPTRCLLGAVGWQVLLGAILRVRGILQRDITRFGMLYSLYSLLFGIPPCEMPMKPM